MPQSGEQFFALPVDHFLFHHFHSTNSHFSSLHLSVIVLLETVASDDDQQMDRCIQTTTGIHRIDHFLDHQRATNEERWITVYPIDLLFQLPQNIASRGFLLCQPSSRQGAMHQSEILHFSNLQLGKRPLRWHFADLSNGLFQSKTQRCVCSMPVPIFFHQTEFVLNET